MGKSRRSNGGTGSETSNDNEYQSFTTEDGKHSINVREVTDEKEFLEILRKNKESINKEDKWRVDAPTTEKEIREWIEWHPGVKMYVTDNGTTGAVTPEGDMIALSSSVKGEGSAMFEWQIKNGGRFLDSYEGNYNLYRHLGFVPVSYTPFNEEYVDKGWYNTEKKPREDVIFMVYGGKQSKPKEWNQTNELRRFKQTHPSQMDTMNPNTGEVKESGYDKAEQQRKNLLERTGDDFHTLWRMEGLE